MSEQDIDVKSKTSMSGEKIDRTFEQGQGAVFSLEQPDMSNSINIKKKERTRVRLVIGIPALMILISLTAGILSYEIVMNVVDHADLSLVKGRLEKAANTILLANFIASGIALIFGVGLAAYIIRPIRAITKGVQEVAKGDLTTRVSIPHRDELGDLGDSFNALISHLNNLFKERNRFILEGFSEGLTSTDGRGYITAVNTQAENILGMSAEQVVGKNIGDILSFMNENLYLNEYLKQNLKKPGRQVLDRVSFVNAKGKRFNLSVRYSPIIDRHGNPVGSIIEFRDLSTLALFTEQIQQADRLAAIGSFATGIAHELRNPLGSIKGVAQLMTENTSGEKLREYTDLIVGEVNRLDLVVQTLLNFAHPEPEKAVATNINDLVIRALNQACHNPRVEKILPAVTVEKALKEIPLCLLQPDRMTHAFTNIINNAFQAVELGGKVKISTGVQDSENGMRMIEVQIMDDGPPISANDMERIFEPFFTTRPDGTGLGLPIAFQIVISNGGKMEVKSRPEETVFIVQFPSRELVGQSDTGGLCPPQVE
jgi:PAS domain S-box-containing protein